jgi:hypothetical protein
MAACEVGMKAATARYSGASLHWRRSKAQYGWRSRALYGRRSRALCSQTRSAAPVHCFFSIESMFYIRQCRFMARPPPSPSELLE